VRYVSIYQMLLLFIVLQQGGCPVESC